MKEFTFAEYESALMLPGLDEKARRMILNSAMWDSKIAADEYLCLEMDNSSIRTQERLEGIRA